jgi:hypothetical protein
MAITDREAYEVLSSQMDEIWGILKPYGIDEDFFSEDPAGAVAAALYIENEVKTRVGLSGIEFKVL